MTPVAAIPTISGAATKFALPVPDPKHTRAGSQPLTAQPESLRSIRVCLGRSKPGTRYELASGEDAPLLAIRQVLGLPLDQPLPPLVVKLGTTRGTNALLTRTGARTAFVTTRGFADVLKIANQDRPRLFDLEIHKPEPLFAAVVEIDERLDAFGTVLRAPRLDEVRQSLAPLA